MKTSRYVIYEDHIGWVLTTLADYELLEGIHRAIRASTWGDFLAALPKAERDRLLHEHPDLVSESSNEMGEATERRFSVDAPFDPNDLPGFCDGDYPPWPAQDSQVSDAVCREAYTLYGKRGIGFIHSFHHLHDDKLDDVQSWLESLGHTLERRDDPGARS